MARPPRLSDTDLLKIVMPMLLKGSHPTYTEIAEATKMSVSGVRYRLARLDIQKQSRFTMGETQ